MRSRSGWRTSTREIVALTIAGGNVGLAHTTRNALKLLDAIGAGVPVFPGSAAPLVFGAACGVRARRGRLWRHRLFRVLAFA
jgi:hypothetical protein